MQFIQVDGVTFVYDPIACVKQGVLLGPELFTFFMEVMMKTMRADTIVGYALCIFHTCNDLTVTGRRPSHVATSSAPPI